MKARNELNTCLYLQKTDGLNMPHYHDESAQYSEVQNGDVYAVRNRIENGDLTFISDMKILSDNSFRNSIYHFVLAASAIARACMEGGTGHDEAYTLSDIYILTKNI